MQARRWWRNILILATIASFLGCGEDEIIRVPERPPQVDTFEQVKVSAIDILFVIDNSGSMERSQHTLSSNFKHFFHLIDPDTGVSGEVGEVDYRLAITTTDVRHREGMLEGERNEPLIIRGDTSYDPLALFSKRVLVGTKGSAREEGFRAAELAIENARAIKDSAGKPEFLRDGAYLYIVFVSDEDDESRDEVRYFERRLRALKGPGNEGTVLVSAIAGPVSKTLPESCFDENDNPIATRAERYWQLVQATGGSFGNICLPDWAETLEELAFTGLGLRKRFQLSQPARYILDDKGAPELKYLFESMEVRYPCTYSKDDPKLGKNICAILDDRCNESDPWLVCTPYYVQDSPNGYWFDERENTIVFGSNAVPGPGSVIKVKYHPRDK